ncbi:uncharacterized protein NPIL_423771 [Nephila pilipes]|uniref:DUF5641 domain-containing protein n=1 Tax=Nephila pilipes TaxID=299642 RepID=A0A8X6P618_NEPPI|nr:uncharacterized protein NPIL_423771 [Nephila pilipes]
MKQKYWIVGAKTAIRKEVKRCVTCARFSSEFSKQIMADLPAARVNPGRAFLKGGMDFAGPFLITPRRGRGVKAIKMHILSQEEFSTSLTEIEAVLLSPPLVAASDDPNDFSFITPGHFLIGSELKSVPEPDYTSEKIPIRERWKLVAQISQSFWKSWSKDYLTQLQVRNKWKVPSAELSVNDLVLIKDDNLSPLKWKMARVIHTYKGTDDIIRAVNLKTVSGEMKRPIHKLIRLPVKD